MFLLITGLTFVLSASGASAGPPERVEIPDEAFEDFSIPAGACSFPVAFHVVAHDLHTITFFDDQGNPVREITEGRLVVQMTNANTGTSVIRNVSGPAMFTFADSIRVATGPALFWFFPEELPPGSPGAFFINYGRIVTQRIGATTETLSQSGIQEDLCATLG